jgi:Flp pilus assembly pilin Flp
MGIRDTLVMIKTLQSFLADKSAVTAIEYAMKVGLGGTLKGFFMALSGAFP